MAERRETWLPRGELLDDDRWRRHHGILMWLLAAHVPLVGLVALLVDTPWPVGAGAVAGILAGLVLAAALPARMPQALAVTSGLLLASAALVALSGGLGEAHFHLFVVLSFIALYHDWRPYALALAFVVLGHGGLGILAPTAVYDHEAALAQPWLWAALHGGFVLAVATAHLLFWRFHDQQQRQTERYYRELYEGERAIVSRLRELEGVKSQLIGVVSHEFRTPLTSVLGYTRTMQAHLDQLDDATVREFLHYIELQGTKLSGLVDNLIAAADASGSDPRSAANLRRVAARVGMDLSHVPGAPDRRLSLRVPGELEVPMSAETAHLVLFNLLDNAIKFGAPGTEVQVEARHEGAEVVVEVANAGAPIPSEVRARMFDAFVQGDSSDSRPADGMGMGLHVVRRIVESHHGSVDVRERDGQVVFEVRLPDSQPVETI
jgi:signal transduction histidine kinase